MPLVFRRHPLELITKARRPRLRTQALNRSNDVWHKHVKPFARAFREATRIALDSESEKKLKQLLNEQAEVDRILELFPAPSEGLDDLGPWAPVARKLEQANLEVVDAAGKSEMKWVNEKLGTNGQWTIEPGPDEVEIVVKARKMPRIATIPANPYAKQWAKNHAGDMARELSQQQHASIRSVVTSMYSRGARAETIVEQLRARVGLLERELIAVDRRYDLLIDQGFQDQDVLEMARQYAEQLRTKRAIRIARTETFNAQAEGRNQAWQALKDSGEMPPVERAWVEVPTYPNGLTCVICHSLGKGGPDGGPVTAEIGESYSCVYIDGKHKGESINVMRPPAHPHCRCTEVLRRKDEA